MFKVLNLNQSMNTSSQKVVNKTPPLTKRLKIIESSTNKLSSNIFIINNNKFLKEAAAAATTQLAATSLNESSLSSSFTTSNFPINNVKIKSYYAGIEIDPKSVKKLSINSIDTSYDQQDLSTNSEPEDSDSVQSCEDAIEFIGAGIKLEKSNLNKINKYRGSKCVNFKEIVNIYEYPSFESFILS